MGHGRAQTDARAHLTSNRKQHILVTGAAGFIGSHLCEALLDAGHRVRGLDCFTDYYSRDQKEANLVLARERDGFELVDADLRTDDLGPALDGIDVVINEAVTPGLALSWDNFEQYESCNVYAVTRLIKACQEATVTRFVQASTSSVYGAQATGAEDQVTRPISPYGVTKLAAEQLLLAYNHAFSFPVVVLRYFSIYGPRQRPDMAYRIFCEKLLRDQPLEVFGDGLQSRGQHIRQ